MTLSKRSVLWAGLAAILILISLGPAPDGSGRTRVAGQGAPTPTRAPATSASPTPTSLEDAGLIRFGEPGRGQIGGAVYRQFWRFTAEAGTVIDIVMAAVGGDLDPFLSLVGPTGEVLATNESASGGLDAGILAFRLPYNGEYIVIARRSGELSGRAGRTAGPYSLTVTLRGPEAATRNSLLSIGAPLLGRLTADFPQAVYRLEIGGGLALYLDLGGANRLARLRVLTLNGEPIADFQGLSPLTVATRLPSNVPLLLEVSAARFEETPFADFRVAAFRLNPDTVRAAPLQYGTSRQSSLAEPESWFFVAEAGDLIELNVLPDRAALGPQVRVIGPGGAVQYQGTIGSGVQQALTLPTAGLYEVLLLPGGATDSSAYTIRLERVGINYVPFARYALAEDLGPLATDQLTEAALSAPVEARWLDARDGQVITLSVVATNTAAPLGLALQRPDGTMVAVATSRRDQPAVLSRLVLRAGRYRVLVFRLGEFTETDRGTIRYRLRYEEVSGGPMLTGQKVKGAVSPNNGMAVWTLDVAAGALINVQMINLNPTAWSPALYIAEPGGLVLASANATAQEGRRPRAALLGIAAPVSGTYQIIVAGLVNGSFAGYELLSDVQIPFQTEAARAISVEAARPLAEGRYAPAVTAAPVRIPIAELVNPLISPSQVPGEQIIPLGFDTTARGEIARGTLAQVWRFTVGSNVIVQARATSLTRPQGPQLTLWNRNGQILYEQYRAAGPTTVLTYRIIQGGTYDLVVNMGLGGGRYTLTLETLNVTDGTLALSDGTPLVYGQSVQGELFGSQAADAYYFLGTTGDVIAAQVAGLTGRIRPALSLITPSGRTLAEFNSQPDGNTAALSELQLPEAGVYTLTVRNLNSLERADGRYTLSLNRTRGVRLRNRGGGILQPGTSAGGLLVPEDNEDTWLFRGRQGERVTFVLAATGVPSPAPLSLRVLDTAGNPFAVQTQLLSESVIRLDDLLLPGDGVYRVQVIGGVQSAGVYRLSWEPSQERTAAGPLRYGQTVSGIFTPDRPFETWVFSGTAGDVVSIALRYVRGNRFAPSFQLRSENGVPLATVGDLGQGARADVLLPFSGSYSVVVANPTPDFSGAGVYSLSVNLQESRARSAGGILRSGEQGIGDLYIDDPQDTWVFGAQAGDRVRIDVSARDRFLRPTVELHTPTGEVLASAAAESSTISRTGIGGDSATDFVIPNDGSYVIVITGGQGTTGSYLLSLTITPPPLAEIERLNYGETTNGLIADDRPEELYTFSGQQGDRIRATMSREPGAVLSPVIELRTAEGEVLARVDSNDRESIELADFRLPYTGEYRLVATRFLGASGQSAGRYTIRLEGTPQEREAGITVRYDQQAIGRLNDTNPRDLLSFEGRAGEVIGVSSRATSGDLDITLTLQTATGIVLAANDDLAESEQLDRSSVERGTDAGLTAVLPADGRYTVIVGRAGSGPVGSAGNYEVFINRLYRVGTPTTPTQQAEVGIAYGARLVGAVDPETPEVRYNFSGGGGDTVGIVLLHQTDDAPPLLTITDPAGTLLAQGQVGVGRTTIERYRLPADGRYILTVRRPVNARTRYSPFALSLDLLTASARLPSGGGVLTPDSAVAGTFEPGETAHYWLLAGRGGQSLSLNLLWLNGNLLPSALLIAPNGRAVRTLNVQARAETAIASDIVLPADGLYSILVLPGDGDRTGQYRLIVQNTGTGGAVSNPITPGQAASGLIDAAQPIQRYAFQVSGTETISARMIVTGGNLEPRLLIVREDGQVVAEGALQREAATVSSTIAQIPSPGPGTYYLVVSQASGAETSAGSYRLLFTLGGPDSELTAEAVAARLLPFNQPVRGVVQGGRAALWAFIGEAGDVVNIAAMANNPGDGRANPPPQTDLQAPALEVQDVSGNILASAAAAPTEVSVRNLILPESGRYVVVLRGPTTVSYSLVIGRRQAAPPNDVQPRTLVLNIPLQNGISPADLVDYWTFNARAGQAVAVEGTRLNGDLRLDMALYGPNGYISSATADLGDSSARIGPLRVPDEGRYLLVVTRWLGSAGRTVGGYRLTLTEPNDVPSGGSIPAYGFQVAGRLDSDVPSERWTFEGRAGDVIEVGMARLNGDLRPTFDILSPNSQATLISAERGENTAAANSRVTLPESGRYTIRTARSSGTSGAYRLTVRRVATAVQSSVTHAQGIGYGDRKTGELTPDEPALAWVFFGQAGDPVIVEAAPTAESDLDPNLRLLGPDGRTLSSDNNSGGGLTARLSGFVLPANGFYGIVVSGTGQQQFGAVSVSLDRGQPTAAYQGTIRVDETVMGVLSPEQPVHGWIFEAGPTTSTIAASLSATAATFGGALRIVDATGRSLPLVQLNEAGVQRVEAALTEPGRYMLLIESTVPGAQGAYRLTLQYTLAPTGGGVLLPEQPVTGSIQPDDFSDTWRLDPADSDAAELWVRASREAGDLTLELTIFGPDGAVISTGTADVSGSLELPLAGPFAGPYTVIVSRVGGPSGATAGDYRLLVESR